MSITALAGLAMLGAAVVHYDRKDLFHRATLDIRVAQEWLERAERFYENGRCAMALEKAITASEHLAVGGEVLSMLADCHPKGKSANSYGVKCVGPNLTDEEYAEVYDKLINDVLPLQKSIPAFLKRIDATCKSQS